jgi:hypothetical protein
VLILTLGCGDLALTKPEEPPAPVPANPAPAQAPVPAEEKPDKPTHFLKRVAELVDKKQAMAENDKLVEVDRNRMSSQNYLTAVGQGYFAAASRLELLNLQNAVNQMQALNERYPTFAEFKDLLKQTGVRLGNLYEYQMYAYDDETGEICILEDRAHMKRIYEAAGREYPHAE